MIEPAHNSNHRSVGSAALALRCCLSLLLFLAPAPTNKQMLFGSGADIVPSEETVRVRLPTITSGAADGDGGGAEEKHAARAAAADVEVMLLQTRGGGSAAAAGPCSETESESEAEEVEGEGTQDVRQLAAGGTSSPDSSDLSSDEDEEERRQRQQRQQAAASAALELDPAKAAAAAAYAARDAAGAPQPLTPQLVTLSMLPRTQWQNLVHLDTIKVRTDWECCSGWWLGARMSLCWWTGSIACRQHVLWSMVVCSSLCADRQRAFLPLHPKQQP